MGEKNRKRVLVVGAGAAGMSCADTLADHPDRFDVTLSKFALRSGQAVISISLFDSRRCGLLRYDLARRSEASLSLGDHRRTSILDPYR